MLRATIWRDLRWRLLAATLLVAPLAALVSWSYAARARAGDAVQARYIAYLDDAWFHLPGPSAVFLLLAVILAAGGGLVWPREQVAYLLALPISRRRLLFTHVAASLIALGALVLLVDLILAAGAWGAGTSPPAITLLLRSLGVFAAAAVWVCVTIGVLAVVRYPVLALTLVLGAVVLLPSNRFRLDLPATASTSMLARWDAWAFADPRAWHGAVPFESLLTAVLLAVGGVVLALYRLERSEP
jgi:hypothetical protein